MGEGLQDHWKVQEAGSGGSDKQTKDFKKDFKAPIDKVAAGLVSLATIAAQAICDEMDGKRDKAYSAYQAILKKIDPADPKKMEKDIKKVIGLAKSLATEVAESAKKIAEAQKRWLAKAAELATASSRIDQLDAWGDAVAAGFLATLGEIRDSASGRDWVAALDKLESLTKDLAKPFEAYLAQKAAKETYDAERPGFDEALEPGKTHPTPTETMTTLCKDADKALAEIDAKADTKDYVAAVALFAGLKTILTSLEAELTAFAALKKEYEERYRDLEPGIAYAAPSGNAELKKREEEIAKKAAAMIAEATAGRYDKALELADPLAVLIAEYKVKADQVLTDEQRIEKRRAFLDPRIAAAMTPVGTDAAETHQDGLKGQQKDFDSAIAAGDYEKALILQDDMEAALKAYETHLAEYRAQEKEYKDRLAKGDKRLAAIKPHFGFDGSESLREEVDKARDEAEGLAAILNFEAGLSSLDSWEAKIEEYDARLKEIEAEKKRYDARLAEITPRLEAAQEPIERDEAESLQNDVASYEKEMKAAASIGDYEEAMAVMDALLPSLASLEAMLKLDAEMAQDCKDRSDDLARRYAAVKQPDGAAENEDAAFYEDEIEGPMAAMEETMAEEDYVEALAQMAKIEVPLVGYEKYRETLRKQQVDYDKRIAAVDKRLADAQAPRGQTTLEEKAKELDKDRDEIKEAAGEFDFAAATALLGIIETKIGVYETSVKDALAEEAAYKKRLEAMKSRLEEAEKPLDRPWAVDLQRGLAATKAEMTGAATEGLFELALGHLDELEMLVVVHETAVKQDAEAAGGDAEEIFRKRYEKVAPDLALAERSVPGDEADGFQETMREKIEAIQKARDADDYAAALDPLSELEVVIAALKHFLKKFDAQKAEYDKRMAVATSKLTTFEETGRARTESAEKTILRAKDEVEDSAVDHDYAEALRSLDDLEAGLAEYEAHLADVAAEKKRFEEKLAGLATRMLKIKEESENEAWEEYQGYYDEAMAELGPLIEDEDYLAAIPALDLVEQALVSLETMSQQDAGPKKKYLARRKVIDQRLLKLDRALETEEAIDFLEEIDGRVGELDEAAKIPNYEEAEAVMDLLVVPLAALEVHQKTIKAKEKDYLDKLKDLETRLARIDPMDFVEIEDKQAEVRDFVDRAKTERENLEYDSALHLLESAGTSMIALESLMTDVRDEKAEAEKRYKALKTPVEEALKPIDRAWAADIQKTIETDWQALDHALADEDWEPAISIAKRLDEALAAMQTIAAQEAARREEFADAEAEYIDRHPALAPRIAAAAASPHPELAKKAKKIRRADKKMRGRAKRGQWDKAVQLLDCLEVFVTGYEEAASQLEAAAEEAV